VSALALACASGTPAPPTSGKAVAWGYVTLVPRGELSTATGGAYGDRRLRDAELVDYSRPGFAVVYVASSDGEPPRRVSSGDAATRDVALTVETCALGARLAPRHAALAQGDRVVVSNRTDVDQLVSCPSAGVVAKIAAGESLAFTLALPGEHAVHLLGSSVGDGVGGSSDAQTTLFVAPGPFSTLSAAGRFVLEDLAPGRIELRSWHPRFPPRTEHVELTPGESRRLDIEIGVGLYELEEPVPAKQREISRGAR
jgi:hypothetical protein